MEFKAMEQELTDKGINPVYIKYINDLEESLETKKKTAKRLISIISNLELEIIELEEKYKI